MQLKIQFEVKAQQILCRFHNEPISHLNIKKNLKQGDRLICGKCDTQGTLPSLKTVEHFFKKGHSTQNKQMESEIQSIKNDCEKTISNLKICKENFEENMKKVEKAILNISVINESLIREKYSNQFTQIVMRISSQEPINEYYLQDIAQYLSTQTILENNDLKLKNQPDAKKSKGPNIINLGQINIVIKELTKNLIDLGQILKTNQEPIRNKVQERYNIKQLNYEKADRIGAVAISNNQKLMASGDRHGKVLLWDFKKYAQIREFNGEQYIGDIAFSNDDRLLAVEQFCKPNHILIFDLTNLIHTNPYKRLEGHDNMIRKIQFSSDSQMLFSVSWDKTLKIWNIGESKVQQSLKLDSALNGLSLSPNDHYIACGGDLAYLLDSSNIKNINLVTKWKAHQEGAYGVLFTPDSQVVVTSYKEIKLWSVQQLRKPEEQRIPLKVFQGENRMWCLQIRQNDRLLSNDGKIKVWDMNYQKLIISLDVPGGYQEMSDRKFSFTQDMKVCITGGESCKLNVLQLMEDQQ